MPSEGGAYVSEGTYGCVFAPPLACKKPIKSHPKPVVGKVFSRLDSATDEVKEIARIRRFDPDYKFTIPYVGKCSTAKRDFVPSDETNKCVKHIGFSPSYTQLVFEHGGYELTKLFKQPNATMLNFDDVIAACLPVFEGIKRMQKKGLGHFDIKPENILIDDSQTPLRINLIDFGLMGKLTELKSQTYMLEHSYMYFPPEYKILHHVNTGDTDLTNVLVACWKNLNVLGYLQFQTWMNKRWPNQKYAVEMTLAVYEQLKKPPSELNRDFDKIFAAKADVYGLGIALIEVIFNLESKGAVRVRSVALFESLVRELLLPMVHPNAYKRISMDDAIVKLKSLIRSGSPSPSASATPAAAAVTAATAATIATSIALPHTKAECEKLKVVEIRALLEKHGLPKYGNKDKMCERLTKVIRKSPSVAASSNVVPTIVASATSRTTPKSKSKTKS
jgi:serine/threonine protein kinase